MVTHLAERITGQVMGVHTSMTEILFNMNVNIDNSEILFRLSEIFILLVILKMSQWVNTSLLTNQKDRVVIRKC